MEVSDYFEPVDFSQFMNDAGTSGKFSLGAAIEKKTASLSRSTIAKLDVALIGIPVDNGQFTGGAAEAPGLIRKALYRLAGFYQRISIADFGNLRPAASLKGTFLALRDIVEYFEELGVVTVVMGGSQDLTVGICEAFKNRRFFSFATVDAVLDVKKGVETFHSDNFLTRIFSRFPGLFQFSLVGYQNHLTPEKFFQKTQGVADHLRLGQLRDHFSRAEPVLRNSDVLSFDIGALKYADAPAARQRNPNGLRSEEACQLARYAGMSNRLKVFGVFELIPANDLHSLTAKLAGEMIWYFLEGVLMRKANRRAAGNNRVVYKVAVDDLEEPFVFLKDPLTDRWWYEVRSVSGEKRWIACTEEAYIQAAANEIPDRWLKFVQKMDDLSK